MPVCTTGRRCLVSYHITPHQTRHDLRHDRPMKLLAVTTLETLKKPFFRCTYPKKSVHHWWTAYEKAICSDRTCMMDFKLKSFSAPFILFMGPFQCSCEIHDYAHQVLFWTRPVSGCPSNPQGRRCRWWRGGSFSTLCELCEHTHKIRQISGVFLGSTNEQINSLSHTHIPCAWPPRSKVVKVMPAIVSSSEAGG